MIEFCKLKEKPPKHCAMAASHTQLAIRRLTNKLISLWSERTITWMQKKSSWKGYN